jgi:hypothetical protein
MPNGLQTYLFARIISCLIAGFASQVVSAAEPKRVLLLHPSSGLNLRAAINVRSELERQSPEPLEIYDASVLTGRPADDVISDRYGDYLDAVFPDKKLDLAVVVGGASLQLIFEPFYTTKCDGMGMGLSIARTIIDAHGGRIWAENQTPSGAVFHVSLPLVR